MVFPMESIETMSLPSIDLTREHFPHMTDEQYGALPRMVTALGAAAVEHLLLLQPSQQVVTIESFLSNETLVAETAYQQALARSVNTRVNT
jgi:hypothetical protein